MPSSVGKVIALATQHSRATSVVKSDWPADLSLHDLDPAGPDEPDDWHQTGQLRGPPAVRQNGPLDDHRQRVQRMAELALAGTTPTLLPELMRSFSQQAGHLARNPFNAFDNNPFIMREWLIVSQVLQSAARTLEKRFEALFLGL